jgi:hypothetical protein
MSTATTTVPPAASLGKAGAGGENQRQKRDLDGAHMETPQNSS